MVVVCRSAGTSDGDYGRLRRQADDDRPTKTQEDHH